VAESSTHVSLVSAILNWIEDRHGNKNLLIMANLPAPVGTPVPPCIEGFVPDVWAKNFQEGLIIVGEAKTSGDLENRHSADQLSAFLRFCDQNRPSCLVIAVPWMTVSCAKAFVRYLKRRIGTEDVPVVFLDMLPG
jgi:hypothetical protein